MLFILWTGANRDCQYSSDLCLAVPISSLRMMVSNVLGNRQILKPRYNAQFDGKVHLAMCHCIYSLCFEVLLGYEYSECSDGTSSLMTDQSRIYSAVCLTRAQFQFVGMFVMLSAVEALKEREVDHLEMCTISLQSVIEGI